MPKVVPLVPSLLNPTFTHAKTYTTLLERRYPSVPIELVIHITSYLKTYTHVLAECIRVCRQWYHAILPHLYHTFIIRKMSHLMQLKKILNQDTQAASWTEFLCIAVLDSVPRNPTRRSQLSCLELFPALPEIMPRLKKLHTIQFNNIFIPWSTPSSSIPTQPFLQAAKEMVNVHTVEFHWCAISQNTAVSLVSAFPNVSTILWSGDKPPITPAKPELHGLAQQERHDIRVETLRMLMEPGGPNTDNLFQSILPILARQPTCYLHTLHLDLYLLEEDQRGWYRLRTLAIFQSLADTLRRLTLKLPVSYSSESAGYITRE